MTTDTSRARRWLMLVLLSLAVILLTSPYESPKERPFLWAAEPIHTRKVTDRVALSPPVGYSFWTLEPPDTAVLEDWTVYPLNEQEPGALRITAHEEKFWTFMETFEDHCIEKHHIDSGIAILASAPFSSSTVNAPAAPPLEGRRKKTCLPRYEASAATTAAGAS